tara:strand:- start:1891 stop:3171 length:1281 start_codon:yes stop_codon:yes gene_type:complete
MSYYRSIIFFFVIIGLSRSQQSFEEFKRQQQEEFDQFKQSVEQQYSSFKAKEEAEFKRFKEDVERQWEEYKGSTAKTYVSYDQDLQSRALMDFDKGEVTVEVIIEDQNDDDAFNFHDHELDQLGYQGPCIFGNYLFILNSSLLYFPQTADHVIRELSQNRSRPVLQKLADTKLVAKLVKILSEKDDAGDPILEDQITTDKGAVVRPGVNDKEYAMKKVSKIAKNIKNYIGKDGKKRTSFSLKFKLRPDHKEVRVNKYEKQILKQAKRFNIDPSIAMAVTETESSFNPKATSHIPAYGLMQLVPSSGGRDAYKYVYGKDKFLGKRYLYKPNNNIELGCAYLGKIRYQYFKGIEDDEKAMMCTVAAYNTGAGNVSKALTNTTKLSPAVKKANKMSPKKLYKTLLKDLEYEETRNYLKKVWERKEKYAS